MFCRAGDAWRFFGVVFLVPPHCPPTLAKKCPPLGGALLKKSAPPLKNPVGNPDLFNQSAFIHNFSTKLLNSTSSTKYIGYLS